MNVISVSNVSYSVEKKKLLQDISFQVEEGDSFALLGENGSGKSTLIDIILKDLKPTQGSVLLLGRSQPLFNKIGVVYDQLPLFPMLKIKEIIRYFSVIHRVSFKEIQKSYFDIFKIHTIQNSFVSQLSLGERKRTALLLAILHSPEVLILDEPFANIDPTIVDRIWNILSEKSKTIFFTSHNWEKVASTANKLCFLRKGELTQKPILPDKLLSCLPAKKKIVLEYNEKNKKYFSHSPFFVHDGSMYVFYDDEEILKKTSENTMSYSIKEVDLKDAYLYQNELNATIC